MVRSDAAGLTLSEADLEFVVREAAPDALDTERWKRLMRDDEGFRRALVGDDAVFQRVVEDEEIFLKVSAPLYFEVLLRRAQKELEVASHTLERTGRQSIPVFDTPEVVELLAQPSVLEYLAAMLASFTRIHSYTMPVRVRRGVWRRVKYNDMDIDSLLRSCAAADESQRLGFYKRIADVCLFISGVFPAFAAPDHRQPASGTPRPAPVRRMRRSMEDYGRDGRRFYGLAEEHPAARTLELSSVFGLLRRHFAVARKPLTFVASQYLHARGRQLFGLPAA